MVSPITKRMDGMVCENNGMRCDAALCSQAGNPTFFCSLVGRSSSTPPLAAVAASASRGLWPNHPPSHRRPPSRLRLPDGGSFHSCRGQRRSSSSLAIAPSKTWHTESTSKVCSFPSRGTSVTHRRRISAVDASPGPQASCGEETPPRKTATQSLERQHGLVD